MELGETTDKITHRSVSRKENHQVWRVVRSLIDNFIKVRVDVIKRIFGQQIVPAATPGWTHEDCIELLIGIAGWEAQEIALR